jgi:small subunit ribosomal protein S4
MARNFTPIVKLSRREEIALAPKAIKGMTKHPYKPGQHGPNSGRSKPSQYALQLREKQKVKRLYGLLEKPFLRVVREAERRTGNSGELLLVLLEQRFDNAVYRLGLAPSRAAARQLVTHGHFILNGRRVDIPSILLKPGDEFSVRPRSAANAYFKQAVDNLGSPSVRWLTFDSKKLRGKVTGSPAREDIAEDIHEQLIIEFYSR